MKRIISLLMALMLCLSVAGAEGIEMDGVALNVPAGWRVNQDAQFEEGRFVTLSRAEDTQPQNIFVTHETLPNWDSYANKENGLMAFADLTLLTLLAKMDTEQAEAQVQQYITLRNGGLALKAVFTTQNTACGMAIVLCNGEMAIISTTALKADAAQCESWLDQMLLPLRIQETMELSGMTIGLPAGFYLDEGSGIYFNANNEALNIVSQEATAASVQAVIDEGTEKDLLLLMTQMTLQGIEYSNPQVELIELADMPAMVSSMDITANGGSGCMGTLAALRSEAMVIVSYLGNQGGQQAAADMMQVITYPHQQNGGFRVGMLPLGMPQDFSMSDAQENEDFTRVVLSNQLQPEVVVFSKQLSNDEKAMEPKDMLWQIAQQDVGNVQGTLTDAKWETYEGGTVALLLDWDAERYGVQCAMSAIWMATPDQLIRVLLKWPNGTAAQIDGVLASMLSAMSAGTTVSQGNVTLNIPKDWQLESVTEDGLTQYTAQSAKGKLTASYAAVSDNIRGAIDGMGVQTALEIYLSIWANEAGVEGITIDYAPCENGVHVVTSTFMFDQGTVGLAYLLDGDVLWQLWLGMDADEETARKLLDEVLAPMR